MKTRKHCSIKVKAGEDEIDVGAEIIASILARTPEGTERVLASTQYGMGFIITEKSQILYRNDNLHHDERASIADAVNAILDKDKTKQTMDPKEDTQKFIKAVKRFLPKGGRAEFEIYDADTDEMELTMLEADNPGHGWGTKALKLICRMADRFGIPLMVIPAGSNRKEAEPLTEFYERFGFEGEDALHRSPIPY